MITPVAIQLMLKTVSFLVEYLVAVIDECRESSANGKVRGRVGGDDEGRGSGCPCLANLLYHVYLSFAALQI